MGDIKKGLWVVDKNSTIKIAGYQRGKRDHIGTYGQTGLLEDARKEVFRTPVRASVNGLTTFSASAAGVTNAMAYDALGRQFLSETLSGGDGSPSRPPRVVSSSTRYNALGQ